MLKIAICQMQGQSLSAELRLEEHIKVLHLAVALEARYILFPELSLTGYIPELFHKYGPQLLIEPLEELTRVAQDLSVNFTVGCPLFVDNTAMIGALTFLQDGTIVRHEKRELFETEIQYVAKGRHSPIFEVDGKRLQLCICAELKNEELFTSALSDSADIYCVSALISAHGFPKESSILQGYAARGMDVLLANYIGPEGGISACGRSSHWDRSGQLCQEAGFSEQVLLLDI